MNRKLYILAILCVAFFTGNKLSAQCAPGRYSTEIFPSYTMDSVIYSTPYGLKMDIYQPAGDTIAARPLIVLAHGGSFIDGDREDDSTIVWLCRNFAKRGYVVASIDYRLQANLIDMLDSPMAIDEVVKAISDGRAAIRFFRDTANMPLYRIDTSNIFIGGNSAGAVLYMHVGYLDSFGECTPDIRAAMDTNGGFDGNSGYPGLSSKAKAVINLAGALHSTEFAGHGDIPSVNAQGDADLVVPYYCGYPDIGLPVPVTLCGLGSLEPAYVSSGIYHMSHVFPGASHVPWASIPADFFTVDSLITQFLYNMVCTSSVSTTNLVAAHLEVNIFPNPATDIVNIRSSEVLSEITLFDNTGRSLEVANGIGSKDFELNTHRLSPGIYFLKIRFTNENNAPLVKRIVIE